jgi:hypothetical protein
MTFWNKLASWIWTNPGLPVAKFEGFKLLNPEILEWTPLPDGTEEGCGVVWIEASDPIICLHPTTFKEVEYWGVFRIRGNRSSGKVCPLIIEDK